MFPKCAGIKKVLKASIFAFWPSDSEVSMI